MASAYSRGFRPRAEGTKANTGAKAEAKSARGTPGRGVNVDVPACARARFSSGRVHPCDTDTAPTDGTGTAASTLSDAEVNLFFGNPLADSDHEEDGTGTKWR